MKKVLNKEDLASYIEAMPPATFLTLQGAGEYLRKKAAQTVREKSENDGLGSNFRWALLRAFQWCDQEQGADLWYSLYADVIPDDLGIDIPDPTPVVHFAVGQKVLLKTLEELEAYSGDRSPHWVSPAMDFMAGTVVTVKDLHANWADVGVGGYIGEWMAKAVVQDAPLDPIISDPNDPRVASLIGKEVYYSDFRDRIGENKAHLGSVQNGTTSYPFGIVGTHGEVGDYGMRFRYIRAVEEPETIDVTMADVCAKFDGKNVRIRKE